ncbi:hypothetical protein [Lachnobacterium bovis]|nr:hypothetical protein [Lachnobacterium bovis]
MKINLKENKLINNISRIILIMMFFFISMVCVFTLGRNYEKKYYKKETQKLLLHKIEKEKYFKINDVMNLIGFKTKKYNIYTGKINGVNVTVFWDKINNYCRKNSYKYNIKQQIKTIDGEDYVTAKALKDVFMLDFFYKNHHIKYKNIHPKTWYNNTEMIAHAGGAVKTRNNYSSYTNSKEAIIQNYNLGFRVFEFDMYPTSDNKMALVHDWKKFGMKDNRAFSQKEWKAFKGTGYPDFGQTFTTMMYDNLLDEMLINKDMYIITDTKSSDFSKEETQIQFEQIYNLAKEKDIHLLERIIPQIYDEEMYDTVMSVYPFKSIIFTTYATKEKAEKIIKFVSKHQNIQVITAKFEDKRFGITEINEIHKKNKYFFNHTIDTFKNYIKSKSLGTDGIYTNVLNLSDAKVYNSLENR